MEGLLGYLDDASPSSSPTRPSSAAASSLAEGQGALSPVHIPQQESTGITSLPPTTTRIRRTSHKRKNVRWADPGLLEEVFVFHDDRPPDPSAPINGIELPDDDEGEGGGGEVALSTDGAAAAAVGGASSSRFSFHTSSTITVKRKKPMSNVSSITGRESRAGTAASSGRGSGWWGPGARAKKRARLEEEEGAETTSSATAPEPPYDPSQFEFFCDQCNYTIERGETRYECRECPNEFCLCIDCYEKGSNERKRHDSDSDNSSEGVNNNNNNSGSGKSHSHSCIASSLNFHVSVIEQGGTENGNDDDEEEDEVILGPGGVPLFGAGLIITLAMMFPRRRKGWRWIHPRVTILSLLLSLLLSQSSRADVTFEYRYQNLRGLSDESKQQDAKNDNKVVLLNDLSLEQAYLHRAEKGPMPSEPSASIVQQAARLAAGAYAGDTGNAQGWKVQSKYNFLNSVAIISVRPEGHGCALAFRGSDDRLDWKNDYRARPLPLMLCQQASSHGPLSLLDPVERVTGAARQRVDQWSRGDGINSTSEQSEGEEKKQSDGICGKRLGRYTVHYGFYHSFWLLTEGTKLGKDWSALTSNGTCNPNLSIITGHSLGGAFVIYAKILQWPGIGITLAAPRAVANGSCPLLSSTGPPPSPTTIDHPSSASDLPPSFSSSSAPSSASSAPSQRQQQQQHQKEQEQYAQLPSFETPMTRFYLTDDPVPATLPVSDSLRLGGVGGPWVHCGCAMALEPFIPTNQNRESLGIRQRRADRRNDNEADEGEDKEEEAEQKEDPDEAKTEEEKEDEDEEHENRISFRAKMMGCESNEPLRKREPPSLPPPPPPPLPPLSLAALLGLNNGDRGKEKEGEEEEVGRQEPGIKRHLHTRYVTAIDRACSGLSPDSRRCLLDHVD